MASQSPNEFRISPLTATASWLALLLVGLPCSVAAQVFKCQDASGKVTYQQSACDTPPGKAEASEPSISLGQRPPLRSAIDACLTLHHQNAERFQLQTSRYAVSANGGWDLAVTGLVNRSDRREFPETIRCPVNDAGVVRPEMFRAQRSAKAAR